MNQKFFIMRAIKLSIKMVGMFLICAGGGQNVLAQSTKADLPRVFLMDAQKLQETKRHTQKGDKAYDSALARIEADAKKALADGTYSVTTKAIVPPSGDKHDYMSQAPYFWADPAKKDGL